MADVAEGGAELGRVLRRAPGLVLPSATRPAKASCGSLVRSTRQNSATATFSGPMRRFPRNDGRQPAQRSSHPPGRAVLTAEGEAGFARHHDETPILARMDMLGDHAAGHAAAVEADELSVAVLGDGGVLDPPGGGVEKGRKLVMWLPA